MAETVRAAGFAELTTATMYALLKLRVDVFVVEQQAAYPELDDRDTEPATVHLWLERAGAPAGYLRMLAEPGGAVRIGRVVVARPARGGGIAGRLLAAALERAGDRECRLDSQSYLVGFYARRGFVTTGPEYLDSDGIPHVPMRRPAIDDRL